MAKRFDAPIPLTEPWIAEARQGPRSRDAKGILEEAAARNEWSALPPWAYDWLKLGEEPARVAYTRLFTANEVARHVRDVAAGLYWLSRNTDDALVVDDYALFMFCAPSARHDLQALSGAIERVRGGSLGTDLIEAFNAWMEQASPIRDRRKQWKSAIAHDGTFDAPCLHNKQHDRLGKRGRKAAVPARIKLWGTYAISWMVGNETLAVKIWNRLTFPPELRWVPEAYNSKAGLDYAVKKYSDAKRRLAKDIIGKDAYVNQMIFQGLPIVAPAPPLDQDTSELVLWIFETILSRNVDALSSRTFKASPLEAMVLPGTQGAIVQAE